MSKYLLITALFLFQCNNTSTFDMGEKNISSSEQQVTAQCKTQQTDTGVVLTCLGNDPVTISNGTGCSVTNKSYGADITCGNNTVSIYNGTNGQSCIVNPIATGAKITCGNSSVEIHNGTNGINGANGISCVASRVVGGVKIECGNQVVNLYDGTIGAQGIQGVPGLNGTSCTVQSTADGARITCGNTFSDIYNYDSGNHNNGLHCGLVALDDDEHGNGRREVICSDHRNNSHIETCKHYFDD